MRHRFEKHIQQQLPTIDDKHILVACSGGLDSVVLTYLLHDLNINISLAHCNFSLRDKESDADEEFVVDLAKKLDISVYVENFDTVEYAKDHKLSIQMAARQLRYHWFAELMKITGADLLATAHHLDDDLETFLINTFRGTGLNGLTGIPEDNNQLIRPLLHFSREEILAFAKAEKINWREDSSNKSKKYLRNKMRLDIIPLLKEENPELLQNFKTTQKHLRESRTLIEDYMSLVFKLAVEETPEGYRIHIDKLKTLPNTRALLYALLNPFGFSEWDDVHTLLEAQSGKMVLSKTHILLKDRDFLLLRKNKKVSSSEEKTYLIKKDNTEVTIPIKLKFNEVSEIGKPDRNTIYLDQGKLKYPLLLRKWKEGDFFHPFGMQGKKKLSKVFKDEKLSLFSKQNIWLLCSEKDIVWVVGIRPDDRFKVTTETTKILKIQYQK